MKLQQKLKILFTKSELIKLLFIFLGILLMGLFEVVGVSSIVPFVGVVASPELIHENSYLELVFNFFGFRNEINFIVFLGVAVISILLISNTYQAFMMSTINYFSNMQCHRLAVRLLESYLMQPYSFFLDKNTSELSKNILVEVARVTKGFVMQLLMVAAKLIITLLLFLLLLFVNPLMAITVTIVLGGSYWVIYRMVRQRLHTIGEATTNDNYIFYKTANEAMSGIKDIKLHNTEKEFISRFELPSKKLSGYAAQKQIIGLLPRYLLEVIAFGGIVGIIISLIATKTPSDTSTIMPIIALYVMAGYRLLPALQQIYSGISDMKFNYPAFDVLIRDFSNSISETVEHKNHTSNSFKDKLEISQLSFCYENSVMRVLDKINLVIYPNTTVGLVGSTGSGKTTLVDIILGLLPQKSGTITLDGIELNKQNIPEWQSKVGYVPQSIYLTDDTIKANIAFASPENEIDSDKAKKAAKMANLHEFITTLPEQYKTFVGERGVRLSGGQRQRIGIARALYHNPEVLILDEATSSLDGITENAILEAIKNLSHKKTIIMIAHRLTTLKGCDVIHFMNKGKIIESGTYQQLIESNKEFKRMANNI